MDSKLIKNEINVFYTVEAKEGLFVKNVDGYGGRIDDVEITNNLKDAYKFPNKEIAVRTVKYTNGKLIKHARTNIITEITEEIDIPKEEN